MKNFRFFYVACLLALNTNFTWAKYSSQASSNVESKVDIKFDVTLFVKNVLRDIEKRKPNEVEANVAKYTNAGFVAFLKNGKMPNDLSEKIHSYAKLFARAQIMADVEIIKDKKINKDLPVIMAQIRAFYYEWAIVANKERIKLEKEFKIKTETLEKAQEAFEKTKKEYEQVLRNLRAGRVNKITN